MRTSDYIQKQAERIKNGVRTGGRCASVFAERDCIYSYGYHYPLLFKVTTPTGGDKLFVNRRGYSVTTSKHINYAYRVADSSVELIGTDTSFANVKRSLEAELDRLSIAMNAKKRKDTNVFKYLEWDYRRALVALEAL